MMRLPSVLSEHDLPAAELLAARLDGDLFAVDGCFSPIDEILQPFHRAAAARAGLSRKLIVELQSAAWVWGALPEAPLRHTFCVGVGARVSRTPGREHEVREVAIGSHDLVDLRGTLVTTPLRTVLDLVRADAGTHHVLRGLLDEPGLTLARDTLLRHRNLPNKRRAVARLERCLSLS